MRSRSWRWFRVRMLGLLAVPYGSDPAGNPLPTTRLQAVMYPDK